jgi:hypothetical protein
MVQITSKSLVAVALAATSAQACTGPDVNSATVSLTEQYEGFSASPCESQHQQKHQPEEILTLRSDF